MSSSRDRVRKAEIQALKDEGRAAFEAGKGIGSCPHHYMRTTNREWWEHGWVTANAESQAKEDKALRLMADYDACEKALRALYLAAEIMDYCGGDAWERECTKEERTEWKALYEALAPLIERD